VEKKELYNKWTSLALPANVKVVYNFDTKCEAQDVLAIYLKFRSI